MKKTTKSAGPNDRPLDARAAHSPTEPIGPARRRHHVSEGGEAFLPDPQGGPTRRPRDLAEGLAEELAEEFLEGATLGQGVAADEGDAEIEAEVGGPFVVVPAGVEIAHDLDAANPIDATPEPLPSPMRGALRRPGGGGRV